MDTTTDGGQTMPAATFVNQQALAADLERRNRLDVPLTMGHLELADDQAEDTDRVCRMPDDVLDAVLAEAEAAPGTEDLARRAARLFAAIGMLPRPSSHPELAWSWVVCAFAGLGYGAHRTVAMALLHTHPDCPFDPDETHRDWLRTVQAARNNCGWPISLARVDWQQLSTAMVPTLGQVQYPDRWLMAASVFHLARYARFGSGPSLVLRARTQDYRFSCKEPGAPLTISLGRGWGGLVSALGIAEKNSKSHHRPSEAIRAVLGKLTLAALDGLKPLSAVPKTWLIGPFPRLTGCATEEGIVPVSMQALGVWRLRVDTSGSQPAVHVDPMPVTPEVLEYEWPLSRSDGDDTEFAGALPTLVTDFQLPFDRVCEVFHNVESPIHDEPAYRAMLNAALIAPFMAGVREFPPIYICPNVPTNEGATNTGKSTLAKALACSYSPGLQHMGSLKVSNDGAPAARQVLAVIERHGTAAFDEFLLSKDADHPLSESKLLNLATGDAVTFGKVHGNDVNAVRLSAPLFIAAKVVRGKADMFNRSLRIELSQLKASMGHQTYDEVTNGKWSMLTGLHARVAAVMYGPLVELAKASMPYPPHHWRFHTLRALASVLLSYDANISPAAASVRVDLGMQAMAERQTVMLGKSMDSGLSSSAAESGSTMFTFEHLFSDDFCADDAFDMCVAMGSKPIRDLLRTISDHANSSPARMVADAYGAEFTGTERQLVLALNQSITKACQKPGDVLNISGTRGFMGWHIIRDVDRGNRPHYHLQQLTIAQTHLDDPFLATEKDTSAHDTGVDANPAE
jgi:hypothetical protein